MSTVIAVDWTLIVDYSVMDEEHVPDMEGDAPSGPEYAFCDAIRPDTMEIRVHIDGDDAEWISLDQDLPVYLAHPNDGCSAKGRALFDRLYGSHVAPKEVQQNIPKDHEPWRPNVSPSNATKENGSSSNNNIDNNDNTDNCATTQMPKELEGVDAPVQAVDAPGTLVFKVMSILEGSSSSSSSSPVLPRPRDSSQSYSLKSMLVSGSSDQLSSSNISWKLVTSQRFHWSRKQRLLPLLVLSIFEKESSSLYGTTKIQLAPLVLHPGQALDAWFMVDATNKEDNSSSLSIRVVAQFIPDPVPQISTSSTSSKSTKKSTLSKKSKTMTNNALPSWGAGKIKKSNTYSTKSQVVLKRDPGLSGTRATRKEFDPCQLQLIAEIGQQLKGAKIHVQIMELRKSNSTSSSLSISCVDLSKMNWLNVINSTKSMAPNSNYNTPMMLPLFGNGTTTPVLGFSINDYSNDDSNILGTIVLPLLPFVLGDGHISDTWYPVYAYNDSSPRKMGELRIILQVHSLIAPTLKSSSAAQMKQLNNSTSNQDLSNVDISSKQQGPTIVTDRTLILNIKKAITLYVGKKLAGHVIAPRVTVTLETSNGDRTSIASTSFLDYVAPASSSSINVRVVDEMDSRVSNGSLDAVWREQIYLDIPPSSSAPGKLLNSVLRFEVSDANSAPSHGSNTGGIPPLIFASGSLEMDEALSASLSRPMSIAEEKWISLIGRNSGSSSRSGGGGSSTGSLLIDIARGPLPPTSPGPMRKVRPSTVFSDEDTALMPTTPRSSNDGSSRSANSSIMEQNNDVDISGVLHLNIADISGVGLSGCTNGSTSAFIRARAVLTKNLLRGSAGMEVNGDGSLTYGLQLSKANASTSATSQNASGTLIWDEPLTLTIPKAKSNMSLLSSSTNSDEDEDEDDSKSWKDQWSIVLSVYAATSSGSSSGYDLVAETMMTVNECLSLKKCGDGNMNATPTIVLPRGARTASSAPILRFRASLTSMEENNSSSNSSNIGGGLDASSSSSSNSVDINSVGRLEELEQMNAVGQLKKTFYSLDLDRSNTVSMNELVESLMNNITTANFLVSNDINLSLGGDEKENRKRLTVLFKRMDRDGNGVVTWEEFLTYVQGLQRLAASGIVQTASTSMNEDDLLEDFKSSRNDGDMSTPPDVLDTSNMPNWARTNVNSNVLKRLPLENLKNKSKQKIKKKKKKTARDPTGNPIIKGPPQHQLIFEDSFRWNRKNFDLPKKLTAKEKEVKRLEKEEKRKKQTAVDPADKAEALELQVQQLRAKVAENVRNEKKRTAGQMRAIALISKRARDAENLLKSATSGQSDIIAPPSSSSSSNTGDEDTSPEYLDLKYRYKMLEKENKNLKIKLINSEKRELDMLDERAEDCNNGVTLSSNRDPSVPNTARSMHGRAAIRVEELNNEIDRLKNELEQKLDIIKSNELLFDNKLLNKESDIELLNKQVLHVKGELDIEKEKTKSLRNELKNVVKRLARYERQAQSQSMEQELATTALEKEHARQKEILRERELLKQEQSKAAVKLQAKLRGSNQRKKHRALVKQRKSYATILQSQWRLRMSKKKIDKMKAAGEILTRIQARHRGTLVREDLKKKKEAVVKLQALAKGRKKRREVQIIKKEKNDAAIKLQAVAKGRKERKEVAKMKKMKKEQSDAATKLQSRIRGKQQRKNVQVMKQEKINAATKIQSLQRSKLARKASMKRQEQKNIEIQAEDEGELAHEQANEDIEEEEDDMDLLMNFQKPPPGGDQSEPPAEEKGEEEGEENMDLLTNFQKSPPGGDQGASSMHKESKAGEEETLIEELGGGSTEISTFRGENENEEEVEKEIEDSMSESESEDDINDFMMASPVGGDESAPPDDVNVDEKSTVKRDFLESSEDTEELFENVTKQLNIISTDSNIDVENMTEVQVEEKATNMLENLKEHFDTNAFELDPTFKDGTREETIFALENELNKLKESL